MINISAKYEGNNGWGIARITVFYLDGKRTRHTITAQGTEWVTIVDRLEEYIEYYEDGDNTECAKKLIDWTQNSHLRTLGLRLLKKMVKHYL